MSRYDDRGCGDDRERDHHLDYKMPGRAWYTGRRKATPTVRAKYVHNIAARVESIGERYSRFNLYNELILTLISAALFINSLYLTIVIKKYIIIFIGIPALLSLLIRLYRIYHKKVHHVNSFRYYIYNNGIK